MNLHVKHPFKLQRSRVNYYYFLRPQYINTTTKHDKVNGIRLPQLSRLKNAEPKKQTHKDLNIIKDISKMQASA